jgi:hypothetical protein
MVRNQAPGLGDLRRWQYSQRRDEKGGKEMHQERLRLHHGRANHTQDI